MGHVQTAEEPVVFHTFLPEVLAVVARLEEELHRVFVVALEVQSVRSVRCAGRNMFIQVTTQLATTCSNVVRTHNTSSNVIFECHIKFTYFTTLQ